MLKIFIDRPVLSTVISIIIVILGVIGITTLPVTQYPQIAPPTVSVNASYNGANADVILRNVVIPLEEQINGVEGMTYMTSTSTNDGSASITIYFKLGVNPDLALVNVQNRVSRAAPLLPAEVTKSGVSVTKQQSSNLLFFTLQSSNPTYDQTFLNNYAKINIVPPIQRISGVGGVNVFGVKDYSMRIWLKPEVMASYGLTPDDVSLALAEQNIDAAPGKFGENSNQIFQSNIRYSGRLKEVKQFETIIVKSGGGGQNVYLRDIARIELGALTYSSGTTTNKQPAAIIAVSQTAGSNATEIINATIKLLDEASISFPEGISYVPIVNVNDFLNASITKVIETLVEAFILVFIVVFFFLQDFRSTLIPGIAVPVAIVGTFFFLQLFGFTINLLTLFAMILAIGIVVDDAIVVVEAVHAKLDKGETSVTNASHEAMSEITGAIVAITLVMAAVFIPVSFISGSSGVFFRQFGLTLAVAILISAINALTLSPALCALLLKPRSHTNDGFIQRFFAAFNVGFEALKLKYKKVIGFLAKRKWISLTAVSVFIGLLVFLVKTTPSSFVPNEDQGVLFADISMPPGSSLERVTQVGLKVDSIAASIPEITTRATITGQSLINGTGSNNSIMIFKLKDWSKRKGITANEVVKLLFQKTGSLQNARVIFFSPPAISGFGVNGGFNVELEDLTGGNILDFYKVSGKFLAALNQRPEIQYAASGFNPNYPQFLLEVNVAKCKEAGVSVNHVLNTMQGYYGGLYASNFNEFGKLYRVMVQADAVYRTNPEEMNKINVKSISGVMIPITEFISLTPISGPQIISRFNLFTSISAVGNAKPGFSSGEAINAIKQVAKETLPAGYSFEFSGLTREEVNAGGQTAIIYLLCIMFVYFLLAGLYESYLLPLAVLLSLPFGLCGTYIFAKIMGLDNNIYMQISVIMLIGLLAKNAILIVEYARTRRENGMSIWDAAIEGATERLRPILMTSLAFICGLLPLMLATGVGAMGNRSIGTGAIGGMLLGAAIGILVIPSLYVVFQSLQEKLSGVRKTNT